MNKRYIFMLAVVVLLAATPIYVLAKGKAANVAEAMTLEDGTKVHLEGYIVEKLRDTFYLFRDDTGEIEVEIPDDVMGDMVIAPEDKVKIHGKIERDDDADTIFIKVKKVKVENKDDDGDDDDDVDDDNDGDY